MSENTHEQTVSHAEAKINELREDRAKAQAKVDAIDAKIEALLRTAANDAAIEALAPGSSVAYVYGRALNKRVLSGVVRATNKTDKGVVQLKVETGEGFDAEFNLIDATALLFSADEIEAAQAEIDKAKADAEAAAEAAKNAALQGQQS
ncbi:hypothetical protein HOR13_gp42 [Xanthomonas phage XAJ24]|uniref:Uncharacterized protein n=1 Tax=Xanthomonas phage XAJ24 TaxID=1775250 RepID=A0A1I9L291_9CAUD|nr:hypothetical protein HOR13_gp42 [Xanthomonas phage XAJ24]AMW36078.1 hypothetical protein [Xanthomonas phage XAJ24]